MSEFLFIIAACRGADIGEFDGHAGFQGLVLTISRRHCRETDAVQVAHFAADTEMQLVIIGIGGECGTLYLHVAYLVAVLIDGITGKVQGNGMLVETVALTSSFVITR